MGDTDHCATCGHYREWHACEAGDVSRPVKAANVACELYTTDPYDDGYDPFTFHPDDIANGNAAEAYEEDARRATEDNADERASDLIDDGYGLRARGGLVYFG